jgi:hypothetical protein
MAYTITQNGLCKIIVGTAAEVLLALVDYKYPKPIAMFYNAADSNYHILVGQQ